MATSAPQANEHQLAADEHHDKTGRDHHLEDPVAAEKGYLEGSTVICTAEDNKRILRKTDLHVLSFLMVIYFLQIADKTIIGLSAVYGLKRDAHLVGNQYSTIGAIGYYAQLVAQPLAAFLIVKVRYHRFMAAIVLLWAASLLGMAGSTNFAGLAACRFLLGWFEAAAIPLFSVITISFYRRTEQPLRVACWYGTNGLATIACSIICYGLARIPNSKLHVYQIIYLFFGLITVIVGVLAFFFISDSPGEAKFLSPEDRLKAVERLRANQQGIRSQKFQISQSWEAFKEPKLYLFLIATFCVNAGASTTNVFGPIILQQIVGFTADQSVLLNMPFGFLQFAMIILASYLAQRFSYKGIVLFLFTIPVVCGVALLYALPKTKANQGALLAGYYLCSFLFAMNPMILAWMGGCVAGQSKKTTYYTAFNAASAVGNIVAPYLFMAKDAPNYSPAMKGILTIFAILAGIYILQIFNIMHLNKKKEQQRVSLGLPAKLVDHSMDRKYIETTDGETHGQGALEDQTDKQNPFYIYLL